MKIKILFISLFVSIFLIPKISIGSDVTPSIKAPLYLSFEQRVLLTYTIQSAELSAMDKKRLLVKAIHFLQNYLAAPVQQIQVKNFEEFLTHYRGQWPNTHKVELDLDIIEAQAPRGLSIYVSQSERVQRKIDRFLKQQHDELIAFLKNVFRKHSGELSSFVDESILEVQQTIEDRTHDESLKEEITEILRISSDEVLNAVLSKIDTVGEKIAKIAFPENDKSANKIIFSTLFNEYYARLGVDSKKMIVSSFLGENLYSDDFHRFEILIQNSGPQLQKILQVVAREAEITPDLRTVFKVLESSVKAVPFFLVKEILEAEGDNYNFVYFEKKPLGVGTLAQVYRAKLVETPRNPKSTAPRFIKPGIWDRIEEDHRIFSEIALLLDANPELRRLGIPPVSGIINEVSNTVRHEYSLEETISLQKKAKVYERQLLLDLGSNKIPLNIKVPGLFKSKNENSKLQVQELAIGNKFDKELARYEDLYPEIKIKIAEAFARVWLDEAFFGSGYFHSDIHQGNFLVNVQDKGIDLHVIDFGMGGVLSKSMQHDLIILGAAVELRRADLMTQIYIKLSAEKNTQVDPKKIQENVEQHFKLQAIGTEPSKSIEEWTAFMINSGVEIPYEFVSMNRGVTIINRFLKEVGSKETALKLIKKLAIQHPLTSSRTLYDSKEISLLELAGLGAKQIRNLILPSVKPMTLKCENVLSSQTP